MKASTKRKIRKVISPIRKIGLKNKDFSIISNNCWGGFVYDYFGMQYKTPTIGLFFYAEDYIRFLGNLKYYLSLECKPLALKDSKHYKENLEGNHSILGIIDDIEVVFVHYNTAEEAVNKWNKRRTRVNFNNLLIKYNDQNNFAEKFLDEFLKLNYENKLFFTANPRYQNFKNVIYFSNEDGELKSDIKNSTKYISLKSMLNEMKRGVSNE